MALQGLLDAGRVAIVDAPGDLSAVIRTAARMLADAEGGDATAIGDGLEARERLASTAIGHGVAIPHARVDGLEQSRGAFLRLSPPVDFGAADGEPVDLVLAMAVPRHAMQGHLELLAEVAERFSDPGFRALLRQARDHGELAGHLLDGTRRATA
ncbi:PTS sugar transporter subunit IIA [Novilysobacter defluvii]|uniref:PTS fructose transporter subunit IIA n=1 Tax=Lysobacter defluvii IMMIB APB-9 = DSM 18482 TaxID=1385515 RepID=A0A0A0M713_9GAMM|nr:PTS sugar transporter subunit IIA [Lysobacter defluvii]KGO98808.1 PTS fructose transporter subunit IIA [Lysobacter defluvii IMMIB APB-9 = DSM 18482]